MVSRASLASWPRGSSHEATACDANASSPYGKTPVLICAPR